MPFEIINADITKIKVDAIVNAANETLEGGGGVDYCIHNAAGIDLLNDCRTYPIKKLKNSTVVDVGRCDVGEVIVTKSFNIKTSKYIFHTVAPILDNEGKPNVEHLTLCYESCLQKAIDMDLKSIAFCNLGTGFYGFPKELAAKIIIKTFKKYKNIQIYMCLINDLDIKYFN